MQSDTYIPRRLDDQWKLGFRDADVAFPFVFALFVGYRRAITCSGTTPCLTHRRNAAPKLRSVSPSPPVNRPKRFGPGPLTPCLTPGTMYRRTAIATACGSRVRTRLAQ